MIIINYKVVNFYIKKIYKKDLLNYYIKIKMPEQKLPQTFSRKACLADFFDEDEDIPTQNNYNKNYSNNDTIKIAKNQQEFGHRKRIKP